jgi:L-rhamnose mutarotase
LLQNDPKLQQEYKDKHKQVWPEMQAALKECGWHNYSLFMKKDGTAFVRHARLNIIFFNQCNAFPRCTFSHDLGGMIGTLFGYFESDRTLEQCVQCMSTKSINETWQHAMRKYFPDTATQNPDDVMVELEEIMFINPTDTTTRASSVH